MEVKSEVQQLAEAITENEREIATLRNDVARLKKILTDLTANVSNGMNQALNDLY